MASIKICTLDVDNVSWVIKGAFPSSIGRNQIAEIFRKKLIREINSRGLDREDFEIDLTRTAEGIDIQTISLGSVKVFEHYETF